jgi:vacuolar-type H+-ATPase subunit H
MQASTFGEFKMATEEKYVHSIKQIKEAEERAQKEINEQQKKVIEDLRNFENHITASTITTKTDGEKLAESTIAQARKKANSEAEKIIEDAKEKSKTISSRIDTQTISEIINHILLKEV